MKVLKETFQQSFKLHIYWWELKKKSARTWAVSRLRRFNIALKILRFSESLMLLGKNCHIFGGIKDIVSEP